MLARFVQPIHIRQFLLVMGLVIGFSVAFAPGLAWAEEDESPTGTLPSSGGSAPSAAKSDTPTPSKEVQAGSANPASCVSGITEALACFGTGIVNAVTSFFSWIAGVAASLFVWIVEPANVSGPTGILNSPAIYEMWKFIRDFFNLFFILILLLSAFATIFQVENFSIRKIFLNILFAALIINFSFPITRFLIDLTNVPMYYFLNAILPGKSGGQGFMEIFLGASGMAAIPMSPGAEFTKALSNLVFMFLFSISLLVLGVLMLVRLLALTLLLIFSPFGFAASLLPGVQKLGHDWWSKFWSYAFFGPAAALTLLVAVRLLQSINTDGTFGRVKQATTNMSASTPEANSLATVIFYLIPLILIWTAIGMGNKFSIAGAGMVTGWGEKAAKWSGRMVGRGVVGAGVGGAKFVGRKVEKQMAQTKGLKWLSPTVLKTAWKARSEEQKHRDEVPIKQAAAGVHDTLNKGISKVFRNPLKWGSGHGIDHTEHAFAETQRQAREKAKEITEVSDSGDHVVNEALHAQDNKKIDDLNGALLTLAKNNDLNDWIKRVGKQYADLKDENGNKVVDTDKKGNVVVSSKNAKFLVAQALRDGGEKDEELLAKRVMAISDTATASGNFAFGGMTKFDENLNGGHGGFRLARARGDTFVNKEGLMETQLVDEQAEWAAGKIKNLESQKRQTALHPDSLFTRTDEGFGDLNGEVAKAIINTFTGADAEQVNRSRDDLKEAIHQAYMRGDKDSEFMKMYNGNSNFKLYVQEVVKIKRGFPKGKETKNDQLEREYPPGKPWTSAVPVADSSQKPTKEQVAAQIAKELEDLEKSNKATP